MTDSPTTTTTTTNTTSMAPLEVDNNNTLDDDWQDDDDDDDVLEEVNDTPLQQSSCLVLTRYFGASTSAVLLAYYCPETTTTTAGSSPLLSLVGIYVLIWISLLALHKSNPGYLDDNIVEQVCQEDGLTLLGYEQEEQNDDDNDTADLTRRTNTTLPFFSQALDQPAPLFQGTRRNQCHDCKFAPPLRSHHCRFCDKCVATFDHHCHFIGTCIGERNHLRFWAFVTLQTIGFILCCTIVASSRLTIWTILYPQSSSSSIPTKEAILVLVIAKVYLYPLTLVSTMMWIIHTIFLLSNKTTFECAKGPERIDYLRGTRYTDAPFSRGIVGNIKQFCYTRSTISEKHWKPIIWQTPGKIIRDSDDLWQHPWENKYWTCC